MRSNSGKDEGRNNMRDPDDARPDRASGPSARDRSHISHAKAPADHRGGRKD